MYSFCWDSVGFILLSSEDVTDDENGTECLGCGVGTDRCECEHIMQRFHATNAKLYVYVRKKNINHRRC